MLNKASDLIGHSIQAKDGEIGSLSDLLFDDEHWGIRWLVVETGVWFTGKKVLLPSSQLKRLQTGAEAIPVDLTKEQVKASPDVDTEKPVTRQMETSVYEHYGWPVYWPVGLGATGAAYIPSAGFVPGYVAPARPTERDELLHQAEQGDPHLRSVKEVTGYHIHGSDDSIGHVDDFLIGAENWAIRYIIVDTSNWWMGRQVLIAPGWIGSIFWDDKTVQLDRTRQEIKDAPEYDPERPIEQDYEAGLRRYYDAKNSMTR